MPDITLADALTLGLILLTSGIVAGLVAGLLGVGGGVVTVPILYLVFTFISSDADANWHLAVGTSLAIIIPTAVRSALAHHKHGAVDWRILRIWGPPMALGALLGGTMAGLVDAGGLTLVFAFGLLPVAAYMLFTRGETYLRTSPPAGFAGGVVGTCIGTISAMMGVGGGVFGVMILNLCGRNIHQAIGTAAGFGMLIGLPATLVFIATGWDAPGRLPFSWGYVNLIAFAALAPLTSLTAPWGASLAHRVSRLWLRRVFGVFCALLALRLMI